MDTTESMAREKLCCAPGRMLCVGADCMAWRWSTGGVRRNIRCPDRFAVVEDGMARPAMADGWVFAPYDGSDYPAQWLEPQDVYEARRRGYCGLAGNPDRHPA